MTLNERFKLRQSKVNGIILKMFKGKPMKVQSLLKNEDGSVMVLALIILVLLTLMGLSATNTSTIEVQIANNERIYKDNFYKAEAGIMTAAQTLENLDANTLNNIDGLNWVNADAVDPNNIDTSTAIWNTTGTGLSDVKFTVVESSGLIDLSAASNLHKYTVYGVYDTPGGNQVVLEIGYKKRF